MTIYPGEIPGGLDGLDPGSDETINPSEARNAVSDLGNICLGYLTNFRDLYEIVGVRIEENFGLRRGTIRTTIIRDCKKDSESEETLTISDLDLLTLSEVIPAKDLD